MKKYFKYHLYLLFFTAFLFINFWTNNLLAMDDMPPSEDPAELTFSIIDKYIEYIINNNDLKHNEIVEFLKNNASKNRVFEELLSPALRSQDVGEGLWVKYLDPTLDFLDPSKEEFLFHGTRSTLEILSRREILAHYSSSGWGIYFGRTFKISLPYTTDHSSNIHKTWKDKLVRSVLILTKENNKNFIYSVADLAGIVRQYILAEKSYSLQNLKSIVFNSQEDVEHFLNFFKLQPKDIQAQLIDLSLYNIHYQPLTITQNKNEFISLLKKHQNLLLQDRLFLIFLVETYGSSLDDKFLLSVVKALGTIDELASLIFVKAVEGNFPRTAAYVAQTISPNVLIQSYFESVSVRSFLNIKIDKKILRVIPYDQAIKNHRQELLDVVQKYLPSNAAEIYEHNTTNRIIHITEEPLGVNDIF
jgi:hypothetical protein